MYAAAQISSQQQQMYVKFLHLFINTDFFIIFKQKVVILSYYLTFFIVKTQKLESKL